MARASSDSEALARKGGAHVGEAVEDDSKAGETAAKVEVAAVEVKLWRVTLAFERHFGARSVRNPIVGIRRASRR